MTGGSDNTRRNETTGTRGTWSRGGGLLLAAAALAALAMLGLGQPPRTQVSAAAEGPAPATQPVAPAPAATQPARNPIALTLLDDGRKVLGFIGGPRDLAGASINVASAAGNQVIRVQPGNFFLWPYELEKPTDVTFSLSRPEGGLPGLVQTINLSSPAALEPCIFFVLERGLFRPQQRLNFAGFVRRRAAGGHWEPLADKLVKVQLRSEKKQVLAAELELTSDAAGRIVGLYEFSEGDILDDYTLSAAGYRGTARLSLAEYRKSKIRLRITPTLEGSSCRMLLESLDFLDKNVPGSVTYTAQVVRSDRLGDGGPAGGTATKPPTDALKPEEFVYHEPLPWVLPDEQEMTQEERLLAEAGQPQPSARGGAQVVQHISGTISLPDGRGQLDIPLKSEWLDGHCAVLVEGVLVDQNGREQRATRRMNLTQGAGPLQLLLDSPYAAAGEPIAVRAVPAKDGPLPTVLLAMRLSTAAPTATPYYQNQMMNSAMISSRWMPRYAGPQPVQRSTVAAVPFAGPAARIRLTEPGAYMLVAMAQLPDGRNVQAEVGCVVRPPGQQPALALTLDKSEYKSGELLTADITSRYIDPLVLVTVRDADEIRFWKTLKLTGGRGRLTHRLGTDLGYGCNIEVQYVDEPGRRHLVQQFFRVVPEARLVKIETTVPEVVDAGATIELGLQVNRREPVDLVVSVYDQSLLGVAPDRSAGIASFFLADERLRATRSRFALRALLAGRTLAALLEAAQGQLAAAKGLSPDEANLRRTLLAQVKAGGLNTASAIVLLDAAGINACYVGYYGYGARWSCSFDAAKAADLPLASLLEAPAGQYSPTNNRTDGWRLALGFVGQTLILAETHPGLRRSDYYPTYYGDNRRAARGDAHFSDALSSANSSQSFAEGQAFLSHAPAGAEPAAIEAGAESVPIRRDFSDAAYWNAAVRTDDQGQATVRFKLPDSLTNWQVVVTAVARDMGVGSHKARFTSTKQIMVWPMLPRVFAEGDQLSIYGSIHNRTAKGQDVKVACKVDNGQLLSPAQTTVRVGAGQNVPVYWTYRPATAGFTQILMTAESPAGSDGSLKRLPVVPVSVEETVSASGFCKEPAVLTVPDDVDLGQASLEVAVVPSLAADLVATLDYLVDYPHGCVEQTMSRFLPAVKVAQALKRCGIVHPPLIEKLPKCVDMGVKRLLELQQPDGGWGWNGSGSTHEMMTPYALYGLMEAEKAGWRIGNDQAIDRGLNRLRGFIDNMNAAQAADRIYCMYVYAHRRDIAEPWWTFVDEMRAAGKLSDYANALALELAVQKKRTALADKLATSLRKAAQNQNGRVRWQTAGFSRWGECPHEVTAAAMKALVAYDGRDPLIPGILAFFAETKNGNRWVSTKDTAMIVYALCDFLATQDQDLRPAKVAQISVNGGPPRELKLDGGLGRKLTLPGRELKAGRNTVSIDAPGLSMYRLTLTYRKTGSDIPPKDAGLQVTRTLAIVEPNGQQRPLKSGDSVPRGAYILSTVTVTSRLGNDARYMLVEDPKPSSCEVLPIEDIRYQNLTRGNFVLREDKTARVLYHHEQTGGNVTDRCVLHAELAGEFVAPPAWAELMYQPDVRGHSGTFRLVVQDEKTPPGEPVAAIGK